MIARHNSKSSRQAPACFGAFSALLVFLVLAFRWVEISYPNVSGRKRSSASGLLTAASPAASELPFIPLTRLERLEHATSRRNGDPSTLPDDLNSVCGAPAGAEMVSAKFVYSSRCGLWNQRSRFFLVGTNLRLSDLDPQGASPAEASRSIRQLLLLHRQHGLNVVRLILDCVTVQGAPTMSAASSPSAAATAAGGAGGGVAGAWATVSTPSPPIPSPQLVGCSTSSLALLDLVLAAATQIHIKLMVVLMDWPGVMRQLAPFYEVRGYCHTDSSLIRHTL
eukprot:jgi/Mesvir1/12193/Mv26358-RA.4